MVRLQQNAFEAINTDELFKEYNSSERVIFAAVSLNEKIQDFREDMQRYITCLKSIVAWLELIPEATLQLNPQTITTIKNRNKLLEQIKEFFNENDLKNLSFSLYIDYEALPATGKHGKARELLLEIERQQRVHELLEACRKLRPNAEWEGFE